MPSISKYINAITCGDCVKGLAALPQDSIDLVFADSVVIDEFLASPDGANYEQVGEPVYDPILGEGAGIGIRKGDDDLKTKFNDALAAIIASGEYAEINKKYMSSDIAPK